MTGDRLPLADQLAKAGDGDFLRSVAEAVLRMLMEADVEGLIGAGRHARTGERPNCRNGFRDRPLSGAWPHLWLDATSVRQREGGWIVSVAAMIAVARDTEGRREIVGRRRGPS